MKINFIKRKVLVPAYIYDLAEIFPSISIKMKLTINILAFGILFFQLLSCTPKTKRNSKIDFTYVTDIDKKIALNKVYKMDFVSADIKEQNKERTFATILFDSVGREVGSYLTPPYTNTKHNFYNSQGLLEKITDSAYKTVQYSATYSFDSSKRILTQYWSGDTKDTCLFYFNEIGQLNTSVVCIDIGNGAFRYYKTFSYRNDGSLLHIKSFQIENLQDTLDLTTNRNKIELNFFYTESRVDSTIEKFSYKNGNSFSKTESYHSNGLAIQSVSTSGNRVKFKYYYR